MSNLTQSSALGRVRQALAAGMDPNGQDPDGRTSLHRAVRLDVIDALLNAGANPNLQDHAGLSPLHSALLAGALDMDQVVQRLLLAGANANLATLQNGDSPLHWTYTCAAACQLILFGANPNARNLERDRIDIDVLGHRRNHIVTRKSNRWGFFTGLEEGRRRLEARKIEESMRNSPNRNRLRSRL